MPLEGMHSLIVEIAPALAIHRVIDFALKSVPNAEPGMLYVERQFGILELHSMDAADLEAAGNAILDGIGAKATDQLRPHVLYTDIIAEVTDQHAVITNRNRDASMILPGECLLLVEMVPALFAAVAANEAERVAPKLTLVDCQMIGASGRVFMSGRHGGLRDGARPHPQDARSDRGAQEVISRTGGDSPRRADGGLGIGKPHGLARSVSECEPIQATSSMRRSMMKVGISASSSAEGGHAAVALEPGSDQLRHLRLVLEERDGGRGIIHVPGEAAIVEIDDLHRVAVDEQVGQAHIAVDEAEAIRRPCRSGRAGGR